MASILLRKVITTSFLLLTLISLLKAQDKKNYYPIWTYHQKDINIYGLSVGLGSFTSEIKNTNTTGIKIELLGAGFFTPLSPGPLINGDEEIAKVVQKSLKNDSFSERINGIIISTSGSVCDCKLNGIALGIIGHVNTYVNGLSIAGLMNTTEVHNGLQIALYIETYVVNGVQIGVLNNALQARGLQIGLINDSKNLKGIQFGLWNVNQKRKLPIINWSFK